MKYEYINHKSKYSFSTNILINISFILSFIFLISFLCSVIIYFIDKKEEKNIDIPFNSFVRYFQKEKNIKSKIKDMYVKISNQLKDIKDKIEIIYSIDKDYLKEIMEFFCITEEDYLRIKKNHEQSKNNKYINLTDSLNHISISEEIEEQYTETNNNSCKFQEYFIKFLIETNSYNNKKVLLLCNNFKKYKKYINNKLNKEKLNTNIILKKSEVSENDINIYNTKIDLNEIIYNNIKFIHEQINATYLLHNVTVESFKINEELYNLLTEAIILFEIENKIFNNYEKKEITEMKEILKKRIYNKDEYEKICLFINEFKEPCTKR